MWGAVDPKDGLTIALIWIGRWVLAILGMLLCMWAIANFMKNLALAMLGQPIKTGVGDRKFIIYVIEFLVGFVIAGIILSGSFSNLLNYLYTFTVNFKDKLQI